MIEAMPRDVKDVKDVKDVPVIALRACARRWLTGESFTSFTLLASWWTPDPRLGLAAALAHCRATDLAPPYQDAAAVERGRQLGQSNRRRGPRDQSTVQLNHHRVGPEWSAGRLFREGVSPLVSAWPAPYCDEACDI